MEKLHLKFRYQIENFRSLFYGQKRERVRAGETRVCKPCDDFPTQEKNQHLTDH